MFVTRENGVILSMTRFAMPFRYDLIPMADTSKWAFREELQGEQKTKADRSRRDYFTPETGRVLFERTHWLRLTGSGSGKDDGTPEFSWEFFYKPKDGDLVGVNAAVAAARLVLFEPSLGEESRLFRCGFLLIDICLSVKGLSAEAGPALIHPEILCNFNEVYRYWSRPFDEVLAERGFQSLAVLGAGHEEPFEDLLLGRCGARRGGDAFRNRWIAWFKRPVELNCDSDHNPPRVKREKPGEVRTFKLEPASPEVDGQGWPAPPADPRAFVWTAVTTPNGDGGVKAFTAWSTKAADIRNCGAVLKLVNVDSWREGALGESASAPSAFEKQWLKGRLFLRWARYGTVYGFSPHSGALLSEQPRKPKEGDDETPPVVSHFFSLYFDQSLLLLYLRASTFGFSERLSDISSHAANKFANLEAQRELSEEFSELRYAFALVTNMYQFPLLSSQQQGVEMYAIQRKALDIDELFAEVKEEIETTDEYLRGVDQPSQSVEATRLNLLAGFGLGMSLILAALQIGGPPDWALWPSLKYLDLPLANILLASLSVLVLLAVYYWSSLAKPLRALWRRLTRKARMARYRLRVWGARNNLQVPRR